jgi:hypothetical protein
VKEIKRFILRTLLNAGEPMSDELLIAAVLQNLKPRRLLSDIERARNELEGEYIFGQEDGLNGRTWSLTQTGKHEAAKLQ